MALCHRSSDNQLSFCSCLAGASGGALIINKSLASHTRARHSSLINRLQTHSGKVLHTRHTPSRLVPVSSLPTPRVASPPVSSRYWSPASFLACLAFDSPCSRLVVCRLSLSFTFLLASASLGMLVTRSLGLCGPLISKSRWYLGLLVSV